MTVFHHHGQRQLDTERGSYSLWDQPDPEVPSSSSPKFGWWLLLHSKRRSELLNDMLHQVEQWHGPLPTENGDLSDIQCWCFHKLIPWRCLTRDWWDKLKKMSKAECIETIVPKAATKKEQFTGIRGTYNPHLKRWVIQKTWQYLHHYSSTSGSDPERSFDSPRRREGGEEEFMDSLQK